MDKNTAHGGFSVLEGFLTLGFHVSLAIGYWELLATGWNITISRAAFIQRACLEFSDTAGVISVTEKDSSIVARLSELV